MTWYELLLNNKPELFKIKNYSSNDILFNEFDECNEIGIVLRGSVVISTITYLEKEEIINVINELEVFGDILVFSSDHIYLGDVKAIRKSSVALIKRNVLINELKNDINLLNLFLESISNKAKMIKIQAKLLSHKNIEDRIMYYLSINQKDNIVYYNSINELSLILSLPRPSVSRSLSLLEKKGFIKKEKHIIYILKPSILN